MKSLKIFFEALADFKLIKLIFYLVVLLSLNSEQKLANGLSCVECDSKKAPECFDSPPSVTNCAIHAMYCVTTRVIAHDGNLTRIIRGCSEIDLGNDCNENRGDVKSSKICFDTCWESGCNSILKNTNAQSGISHLFYLKYIYGLISTFFLVGCFKYNFD